jgi:4-hydroxy-4-methyl-2-oxoglutarate aldolase
MPSPIGLRAVAERVSGASICDAMMRRHAHRAHIVDLVSPAPERWILAQAVTMAFAPMRADLFDPVRHEFGAMLLEAAGAEGVGKVLVASCGGHPDQPIAGGKKLSRLANLGMAGVVSDARLRDFDEVVDLGIAAWVGGETVRQAGDATMPIAAGVPIVVAGVLVCPGDWIYADRAGAVVIPADDLRPVLEAARAIEESDARAVTRMREEDRARREGSGPA